jgi:dihydrofolate reductase
VQAKLRCSVYIAVSVDGFIAGPHGELDWLSVVERKGEDYGYEAFSSTVDAMVIGRKTYEVALTFPAWPYAGKRCIVLTHRKIEPCHGEESFSGKPKGLVDELARDGVRRVYVDGGEVIRQFLAAKLIDDMTLSVIPVLLGDGIPLFGRDGPEQPLTLVKSQSWPSGLVQTVYRFDSTEK